MKTTDPKIKRLRDDIDNLRRVQRFGGTEQERAAASAEIERILDEISALRLDMSRARRV